MRNKRRSLGLLSVIGVSALLLAGCAPAGAGGGNDATEGGAGFDSAIDEVIRPSKKAGGTLKLGVASDCDSWDPARTYYGFCWNLQRLISRTLVGYSKVNGDEFELAPDLATGLGEPNDDFTEWSYTLKSGLNFSNGDPITPNDIKYAVERLYATDIINGGPNFYFTGIIDAPENYKGPFDGDRLPDSAIEATDDTITFKLNKPYADFDYLLALPTTAPVPFEKEGGEGFVGENYTKMPVSSGPFVITDYTQQKSVTFERNDQWTQESDTIRKPLLDGITFTVNTDPNDIDAKLKAGTYDAKADNDIGTNLQAQIFQDPKVKANADNPETPYTRYFALPSSVITDKNCRLAIFYALDKAAVVQALGGQAHGQIATSMTPPTIPGYQTTKEYNPYPSGKDGTGDVAKAKEALQACGKPDGFSTKMAYNTPSETAPKIFEAVQDSLARVGIKVTAATADGSTYYSSFAGSPANVKDQGLGIILAGWAPDFPTAYGFYNNIANSASIIPNGNSNYAEIRDDRVDEILDGSTGGDTPDADWVELNKTVMETANQLPFVWGKSLYYRNPRMTNVTANNALGFGIYDWVNVGVSK